MTSNKPFKPVPAPDPEQNPEPSPNERPKRRTFIQPTFNGTSGPLRKIVTVFVLAGALTATTHAQTTPNTTTTPQTTPQAASRGWRTFDDNVGREFNIPADQLQQLREMDTRYQKDYHALGKDPLNHPEYGSLNDRRNAEIRKILTQDTYDSWYKRYNVAPNAPGSKATPGGASEPKKTTP